jgi:hypothetical protein
MFSTTPTDDGAIAVTCDRCLQSVGCPDLYAAATAITHHHCDPDTAMTKAGSSNPRPGHVRTAVSDWIAFRCGLGRWWTNLSG